MTLASNKELQITGSRDIYDVSLKERAAGRTNGAAASPATAPDA